MATSYDLLPAGTIHQDTVVPACEPWSARIRSGDVVRFVDLHGQQAIDFLCYNADEPADRYNAANTLKLNGNIYLGEASVLWSVRAQKLMTVVADTCGNHDTIAGCCSVEIDQVRYGKTNTRGCQQNFESELARYGLGEKDVVPNINLFMNVPIGVDGGIEITEGKSKPGDHIDLRAEMDVLVVISNCPQCDNPASGFEPTPVRAIVYSPA